MHVCLVGPCSPQDLADLFVPRDSDRARSMVGYRGVPVSDLARNLVRAGHRVTVVSTGPAGNSSFRGEAIDMYVIRSRRPRHYLPDLYRVERKDMVTAIRQSAPDLVHAHWTYEFSLAAADSGFPFVTTAHDSPVAILKNARNAYRSARYLIAWRARLSMGALSAVSPYLARAWRKFMAYRHPIEVIPNSIPQDVVATRRPSPLPTILEVADGSRRKNVCNLIRAFASVRSNIPNAELRLVGPGLAADEGVARWARSAGLADGVTFRGPLDRDNLRLEYESAWVLAHAALEESCPMVVLEAHGSRVPVIGGARSGGVPYVLGEGRAGTLVDVRDTQSIGSALTKAVRHGPPTLGEDAVSFIESTFSPSAVTDHYLNWYRSELRHSSHLGN